MASLKEYRDKENNIWIILEALTLKDQSLHVSVADFLH